MDRNEFIMAVEGLKNLATHRRKDKLSGILYLLKLKINTDKGNPINAVKISNANKLLDMLETEV